MTKASMSLLVSLFALAAGGPCPEAAAQAAVGDPAPNFSGSGKVFFRDGKSTLAEYKGEVVLLVFIDLNCDKGPILALEKVRDEYAREGFHVAVFVAGWGEPWEFSTEAIEKVGKYVVGIPFPTHFGNQPAFVNYRPGRLPSSILIGPDQRICYRRSGSVGAPASEIRKALADRWRVVLEDYPGAPRSLLGHLSAGRVSQAYQEARAAGLEELADRLGRAGRQRLDEAESLHAGKHYLDAYRLFETLARDWKGTDIGDPAVERLAEYRSREMRAELGHLERLARLEARLEGQKPETAAAAYRSFAGRCEGSAAAARALELADRLSD